MGIHTGYFCWSACQEPDEPPLYAQDTRLMKNAGTVSVSMLLRSSAMAVGGFALMVVTSPRLSALTVVVLPVLMVGALHGCCHGCRGAATAVKHPRVMPCRDCMCMTSHGCEILLLVITWVCNFYHKMHCKKPLCPQIACKKPLCPQVFIYLQWPTSATPFSSSTLLQRPQPLPRSPLAASEPCVPLRRKGPCVLGTTPLWRRRSGGGSKLLGCQVFLVFLVICWALVR